MTGALQNLDGRDLALLVHVKAKKSAAGQMPCTQWKRVVRMRPVEEHRSNFRGIIAVRQRSGVKRCETKTEDYDAEHTSNEN